MQFHFWSSFLSTINMKWNKMNTPLGICQIIPVYISHAWYAMIFGYYLSATRRVNLDHPGPCLRHDLIIWRREPSTRASFEWRLCFTEPVSLLVCRTFVSKDITLKCPNIVILTSVKLTHWNGDVATLTTQVIGFFKQANAQVLRTVPVA